MPDQYTLVDVGPSFTPQRFGLLTAAELPQVLPEGWRHGTMRISPVCGPAGSTEVIPCSGTSGTPGEPLNDGVGAVASDVFRVYGWETCSPMGWGDDLAELRRRSELRLTNGAGRAIERVFWTGATDDGGTVFPHLAADAAEAALPQGASEVSRQMPAEEVTSTAVSSVRALGLLEGYLGECYGGEGIIHVPRAALAELDHQGVVRREGEQLRTLAGNRVAGYSGGAYPAPDGSTPAAGEGWFYATGMAQVLRGPVTNVGATPAETVGRAQNTFLYLVYQLVTVTFDCCLGAAQVDLEPA